MLREALVNFDVSPKRVTVNHIKLSTYSFFFTIPSRLVVILPGTDKDGCKVCIHRPGKEDFVWHTTIVNVISNCNDQIYLKVYIIQLSVIKQKFLDITVQNESLKTVKFWEDINPLVPKDFTFNMRYFPRISPNSLKIPPNF